MADISDFLRGEVVFRIISSSGQNVHVGNFLYSYCSLGFADRRLSCRLQYTC